MTYRKTIFANNEIYHVINRTIAGSPLFLNSYDSSRFLKTLEYYHYQNVPMRFSHYKNLTLDDQDRIMNDLKEKKKYLIQIIAFCLMTNHVHFLVKQLENNGTSIFMSKLQNSYAKYFNLKHKRKGSLFQSMFKAVRIEDDEQLVHVSRYIHLNPYTAYLCKIENLKEYPWSSYPYYLNPKSYSYTFLSPNLVLDLFKDSKAYEKFVFDQAEYQKGLENIKHLILEKYFKEKK